MRRRLSFCNLNYPPSANGDVMSQCARCQVHSEDLRTIRVTCAADMGELGIPFEKERVIVGAALILSWHEDRNLITVCKNCRADFMNAMSSWFKGYREEDHIGANDAGYDYSSHDDKDPCQHPGCHGGGTAHIEECPNNERVEGPKHTPANIPFAIDPLAYEWVGKMYSQEWSLFDCEVELTKLLASSEVELTKLLASKK